MRPSTPNDLDLELQERGGFQFEKDRRIADWLDKKERTEFTRLCARLYSRNWQRKRRREQPDRVRHNQRRWRNANREKVRAWDRARRARQRVRVSVVCKHCKTTFYPKRLHQAKGVTKWCTVKCKNAFWGKLRAKARNRGIRNMQLGPKLLSILRETPGLTLGEIHAKDPTMKRGSVATKLTWLIQNNQAVRTKGRYRMIDSTPTKCAENGASTIDGPCSNG